MAHVWTRPCCGATRGHGSASRLACAGNGASSGRRAGSRCRNEPGCWLRRTGSLAHGDGAGAGDGTTTSSMKKTWQALPAITKKWNSS